MARNIPQFHTVFQNQAVADLKGAIQQSMLEDVKKKKVKKKIKNKILYTYIYNLESYWWNNNRESIFSGKSECLMFFGSKYLQILGRRLHMDKCQQTAIDKQIICTD